MSSSTIITKIRKSLQSEFFRNTFLVMSGTASAQVIAVAMTPILTRLYDPAAFGVFGVYMSVVSIATSIATLRYDQALMLPKSYEDSVNLLGLSCLAAIATAVLTGLVCIPLRGQIGALLKSPEFVRWAWLLPVSVFLAGAYLTLTAWSTRQKQFRLAAVSHVIRTTASSGSQCGAGLLAAGPFGLIAGSILGAACACLALGYQLARRDGASVKRALQLHRMKKLAREYSDFPIYGSTHAAISAISQNVPLLLLAYYFDIAIAGYYALSVRALQLPANVLLASLRQVLFQKGSEVHNSGGDLYALFNKVTLGLAAIIVIPALIIILFAPAIFSFVFGAEWDIAGQYARWLMLWIAVKTTNLPAVLFGRICRKQRAMWLQGTSQCICRVGAVVVGGLYLSALETIIIYSVVCVVFDVYIITWMWNVLRKMHMEARSQHEQQ